MTYQEIQKQHQEKASAIMDKYGVFWAFSNQQFTENKTPLKDGDKYVSIGAGGYMPKSNLDSFLSELETVNNEKKRLIKEGRDTLKQAIRYELANHECYYTGDISDVVEMFKGQATRKQIIAVYNATKNDFQP